MTDVTTRFILQADQAGANATRALLQGVASDIKALGASDPLKAANVGLEGLSEEAKSLGGRFSEAHSQLNLLKGDFKELESAASQLSKIPLIDPAAEKELDDLRRELLGIASDTKQSLAPTALQSYQQTVQQSAPLQGSVSALRQVGSIAGQVGLTPVQGAADAAASALELGRALPQLKAGLAATAESIGLVSNASRIAGAGAEALALGEGAATAGAVGLQLGLLPLVGIGAAVAGTALVLGAAFSNLSDEARKNAEANAELAAQYKASDDVFNQILNGATSDDLAASLSQQKLRTQHDQDELDKILLENEKKHQEYLAVQAAAQGGEGAFDGRFVDAQAETRKKRQEELEKSLQEDAAKISELTEALDSNATAANDAAAAAKKKDDADKKALEQAKQKEEQRLKEVEAVNKQIADSDRNYGFKRADMAVANDQRLADLDQASQDRKQDIDRKYFNDVQNIALKARREETDAQTKAQRADSEALFKARVAEVNATIKQQRDLQDIKDAAIQDEKKALENRNFLQASLAGEAGQAAIDKEKKDAERAAEDRKAAFDIDKRERNIKNADEANDRILKTRREREDRATAFKEEQAQAATAYQRQLRDADTNFKRQEDAAALAYEREQDQLAKHLEELTGIRAEGYAAEKAAAMGQSAPLRSGSGSTTNNNTSSSRTVNDSRSLVIDLTGGGAAIIEQARRAAMDVMRRTAY